MPFAHGLTKPDEVALFEKLNALREAEKATCGMHVEERTAAQRAWDVRRKEIQQEEVVDPAPATDAVHAERLITELEANRKSDLTAAAAERDAVIARAKATYEKKAGEWSRSLSLQRDALKKARAGVKQEEADRAARLRTRYSTERAAYFSVETELRDAAHAAGQAFRTPLNAAPQPVRDAIFRAMREE